jgi:DMSO/TMAO reductase YedYZ molybdopterin-dependent catalytic subunit
MAPDRSTFTDAFGVNRRRLVGGLAAAGIAAPAMSSMLAAAQDATPASDPDSLINVLLEHGKVDEFIEHGSSFEMPMSGYDEFLTPNEKFFVRANGPVVVEDASPENWTFTITGLVDNEMEFSRADLEAMETTTITAWIECSGNGRGRFPHDPQQPSGTPWTFGGVGNAEWTGVPLVNLLNEAGVQEGAIDIVSQGGDFDEMQRGLPLHKALEPSVMVVWQMNGEEIPNPNGGPLRLLVPGWGGIASTKWLTNIEVIDHTFMGDFNTDSYVIIDEDGSILRPVEVMGPKSVITSHEADSAIEAGEQTIFGFAWSGYMGVQMVQVSLDGGETWEEAEINQEAGPYSWVRFEYSWNAEPGEVTLASRATDNRAIQQPWDVPWNAKGYGMNAIYAFNVTVE